MNLVCKLICKKNDMVQALSLALRAVSSRTDMPIFGTVLLQTEGETLRIIGSDRDLTIEVADVPAMISAGGAVALDAKLLSESVRRLDSDEVALVFGEKNDATLSGGHAQFTLNGISADEFPRPDVDLTQAEKYTMSAGILREMIRRTIFSISTDSTKPTLTGELFEVKDGLLHVVAIDMFRISYAAYGIEGPNTKMIIPGKALTELSKMLPGKQHMVDIFVTPTKAVFCAGNFTLITSLIEGEFVRYEQIFSDDFTTHVTVNRLMLISALERAVLVAGEARLAPVEFDISNNEMRLECKSTLGRASDVVAVQTDGVPITIYFNPRYFLEPLRAMESNQIEIRFNSQLSPATIRAQDDDICKYLVVPMRAPE